MNLGVMRLDSQHLSLGTSLMVPKTVWLIQRHSLKHLVGGEWFAPKGTTKILAGKFWF